MNCIQEISNFVITLNQYIEVWDSKRFEYNS